MTRVATIPLQQIMSNAMLRSQQALAESQMQLDTGKKAQDYAGLGTDAVRVLSARSMLAQQQANSSVATRLGTTLQLYDANLTEIDRSASDLRQQLMSAIGTNDSPGLQDAVGNAFSSFRTAINGTDAGTPLFAGGQTNSAPFTPQTLSDTIGLTPANAFTNDNVRASAHVGDGADLQYGIGASDVGSNLMLAFRTLAEAGPFGQKLTAAQASAIQTAIGQLDTGLSDVRAANAENGRKQNLVEAMAARADDRSRLLEDLIGKSEDADLGQVASDLSQRTTILQASYSVFRQLNELSLANYLR